MNRKIKLNCRIAVIGGGAAGLAAAIAAARTLRQDSSDDWLKQPADARDGNMPVVVLERLERVGKKLLTTGNGRCNLSHQPIRCDDYHGQDSQFAEQVLRRFDVADTRAWFRSLGLYLRTDPDGRVFPYNYQAASVLDLLRRALDRLPVAVRTNSRVLSLQAQETGGFRLEQTDGCLLEAQAVVVATGGLAAPAFGCSGDGYALLTRLGHRLVETRPAIVQICTRKELVRGLAGIRFMGAATLKIQDRFCRREVGEILLTDYGLSGPPVLQLSRAVPVKPAAESADVMIHIDFLPDMTAKDLTAWLRQRRRLDTQLPLQQFLNGLLHKKIGMALVKQACGRSLADQAGNLSDAELQGIIQLIKDWPLVVTGTQGWQQAQVTAGGIAVADFNGETLMSRLVPGLFAAGEVLDIDGDCGGYNLQWAWSSGRLAGTEAACYVLPEADGSCQNSDGRTHAHPQ